MTRALHGSMFHVFMLITVVFGLFALFDDTPPAAAEQTIDVNGGLPPEK